jgi:hypothetical protein
VSHHKIAQVLQESAQLLRTLVAERDAAQEKAAALQHENDGMIRHLRAEKVAAEMHSKGLSLEIPYTELVDNLKTAADQGRLSNIEAAVGLVGTDMGIKTASIHETTTAYDGGSRYERFLLGQAG